MIACSMLVAAACVTTCKSQSTGGTPPGASAASATAADVFGEMRAAACAGDADKFLAHVAEPTLLGNMVKRGGAGANAQASVRASMEFWRKDIRDKAKGSDICAWAFLESEKSGDDQRVAFRSKSGDKGFLFFTEVGGQLELTGFESEVLLASVEPVDLTVDVAQLLKDYKDNELRGDGKYKGKRLRISGKAGEVKRDVTNAIYLTVGTGADLEIPEALCLFGEADADRLSSVTRGQPVVVNCTVDGLMMNVLMKNCALSNLATFAACYRLESAGIVTHCLPVEGALDATGFDTALPPRSLRGTIARAKDVDSYEAEMTRVSKRPGDSGPPEYIFIGSRLSRMIVILPGAAPPSLQPRVQAVIDRIPPVLN
jgi:hypothetical protein